MIAKKWMATGWVAAVAAGMVGAPVEASAQDRPAPPPRAERPDRPSRDCQCLDAQGNRTDRCFCFIMPDVRVDVAHAMGLARRAVLGVNVREDQPTRYDDQGARLYGVEEESPAGKAGLEEGDVLTRVDGKSLLEPLADQRDEDRLHRDGSLPVQRLLSILADHDAGDSLRVEYLRGSDRKTATVVLAEPRGLVRINAGRNGLGLGPMTQMAPMGPMAPMAPMSFDALRTDACPSHGGADDRRQVMVLGFGRSCVAGVELLDMQPGLAEYFGAKDGVLVSDANQDNPLGLRPGDVLLSVDGRDVRGVDRALRVLRSYEGDEALALKVLRKEQTVEVKGKLR